MKTNNFENLDNLETTEEFEKNWNKRYENPFKGTTWENLTLEEYLQMEQEEKQKVKDYLEEIDAPIDTIWCIDGSMYFLSKEHPTWRNILSWDEKDIQYYVLYLKEQDKASEEFFKQFENQDIDYSDCPF